MVILYIFVGAFLIKYAFLKNTNISLLYFIISVGILGICVYKITSMVNTLIYARLTKNYTNTYKYLFLNEVRRYWRNYKKNQCISTMAKIPIEQLIDIVQGELTFSGALPKILPDKEIKRLIQERCLEYFYKNWQYAVIKTYFKLIKSRFWRGSY